MRYFKPAAAARGETHYAHHPAIVGARITNRERKHCRSGARPAAILSLLLLAACASERPITVDVAPVEMERPGIFHPPPPAPLSLTEIKPWRVMVGDEGALFCVTPEAYETMALNTAEVERFIRDAMSRLEYYRGLK